MPLPSRGAQLALTDAGNGRVTVKWDATGNPTFDDSQDETVFSLLLEGPWFGDREKKRRSRISSVKTKDSSTRGRVVEYAKAALQPAIDDGRLKSVSADAQPSGSGYLVSVAYVTGTGRAGAVTVPLAV